MQLMNSFKEFLQHFPPALRQSMADTATPADVERVLTQEILHPQDFMVLLSPAAAPYLEAMAQKSRILTLHNFGRAVNIFTPLYVSDYCTNKCRYCGFNAGNTIARRHLSIDEAYDEAKAISDMGLKHILLLTGDAPKLASPQYIGAIAEKIKPMFSSIGIEVYAMTEEEYHYLVSKGVDSLTMFQETYNPEIYDYVHEAGPKKNYSFRLDAPERACRAGMRSVGLGALIGLDDFIQDAFCTGLHAWWLQRKYPAVDVGLSVPRICPHEGTFDVQNGISDKKFVQYITALRCFLPRCSITVSSRESAEMRNNIVKLGVTRVSAGVSTAVGGRTTHADNNGQFDITDHRSLEEMVHDLKMNGFQAVIKDWEACGCFS